MQDSHLIIRFCTAKSCLMDYVHNAVPLQSSIQVHGEARHEMVILKGR